MTHKGFRVLKSLITSGSTQETRVNVPLGQTGKWLMAALKINAFIKHTEPDFKTL